MEQKTRKITFPHMGNYFVALKPSANLLADEIIVPPPITKKTLEIGTKHGPEFACIPFKYNLGNYVESLDLGANVLIQAGGGCRFGYYGEVQKEILKKLGYDFEFLKLSNNYFKALFEIRKFSQKSSCIKIFRTVLLTYFRLRAIDYIENIIRKRLGFEVNAGEHEKVHKKFLKELDLTKSMTEVIKLQKKYSQIINKIEINMPPNPLRVAVVGELYVLMEPFANFFIEKELAKRGIEVHRFVTVSSILHDTFSRGFHMRRFLNHAKPYLKYPIGAHGTESVGKANHLAKKGFDGIIHIKPFGCMPEVNAMTFLHNISQDHKIPIIYFSFDSQTSETGMKTRIEAFYDMLSMKRNLSANNKF